MVQIVVFSLDQQVYALPLTAVDKVIHAVEITSLPKAPDIIAGIINYNGQILPVIDIRKRFQFTSREINPNDQLIITNTGKRQVVLWVDSVEGIQNIISIQHTDSKKTLPYAEFIRGVVKIEGEIILIYDLEQFLNLNEEKQLENALSDLKK